MRLHWLLYYSARLSDCSSKVKKNKKYFFFVHTTLIIFLISFLSSFLSSFLYFLSSFSFISIHPTPHFLRSFIFLLFSFLKTFSLSSQIFHSNSFLFLLKFSPHFFSIFSLLCEGLFFCHVAMAVVVVGHRRCGHAMGMVSHRFWVMP